MFLANSVTSFISVTMRKCKISADLSGPLLSETKSRFLISTYTWNQEVTARGKMTIVPQSLGLQSHLRLRSSFPQPIATMDLWFLSTHLLHSRRFCSDFQKLYTQPFNLLHSLSIKNMSCGAKGHTYGSNMQVILSRLSLYPYAMTKTFLGFSFSYIDSSRNHICSRL